MLKAYFSPGNKPLEAILNAIETAKEEIKICVFTISDNKISEALKKKFQQGVKIKIISDNRKINDLGSDIKFLSRLGIPVKIDKTDAHMHHKFAIFDSKIVLTGSYNWTVSAKNENYENILFSDNIKLVRKFEKEFNKLWKKFVYVK